MYFLPDDMLKFDMGINIWSRTGTKAQLCKARGRVGERERTRSAVTVCVHMQRKLIEISKINNRYLCNDHADDVDCAGAFIARRDNKLGQLMNLC